MALCPRRLNSSITSKVNNNNNHNNNNNKKIAIPLTSRGGP
jgi:hypothetical protein